MAQRIAVLLAIASILVLSCAADEHASAQKYDKKKDYVKHDKEYKPEYKKPYEKEYKPYPKPDYNKPAPPPYGGKPYEPSYPPYGDKPYDPAYPPYDGKPYPPSNPPAPYGGKPYDPAYSPPYGGAPYPPYGSYAPSYGGYDSSYSSVHAYTACLKEYQQSYCYECCWYDNTRSYFTFCGKHGDDPPLVGMCDFDQYWYGSYQITANLYYEGDFYGWCDFDKKAVALGHPFGEDFEMYVQGGMYYVENAVLYTGSIHEPVFNDEGYCGENEKSRRTSGSKHGSSSKLAGLRDMIGKKGAAAQPGDARQPSRAPHTPHHPPHNSTRGTRGTRGTRARSMAVGAASTTYDYVDKHYYEADVYIFYGYIIGIDNNHGMSWILGLIEYVNYIEDYNVISESDVQGRKILPDPYTYKITLFKQ